MNCPKCNAPITDDSAFCPECGAKVEVPVEAPEATVAPAAFCPECGAPMAADAAFCENCGAKTVEAVEAAPAEKKPAAKWLKLGIAAVALVAIVVLIISLFGGSKPDFALYRKGDELMYSKLSGKPFEISDEDTYSFQMNKDGSKLFYLEDGKLMVRNVKKAKAEPQQLVKGIERYTINEDGSKVFYLKDGALRWCDLKDNGEKIESDVSSYYVSKDGKTLFYTTSEDGKDTLYRATMSGKKVKAEKVKSGEEISVEGITENFKTIIFTVEGEDSVDLYTMTGKKDPVKVASDAEVVGTVYDNGSFFYVAYDEDDDENTLCFWNGKKGTEITKDITDVTDWAADAPVLVFEYVDEESDDYEVTYYVAVKGKMSELKLEDVMDLAVKPNGKELLAIADFDEEEETGTVYKVAIGNAAKEPKKVNGVEDAFQVEYTSDGKKTVFYAEQESTSFTLYVNGKKITDDVVGYFYNEESGMLVYGTDVSEDGFTLWQLKGSKGKKINDDVYDMTFTPDGTLLYLCDRDGSEGDLYRTTNGEGKKIDSEVTDLIDVYYHGK